ncbi:MAG TPA: succinyl-diaminopimelate desuccinylase [Acetobacteraceae bacterium]|nr:succinyl-diaminopimelate desuccinylase [Acetobacteraceae bacterium]
MSSCATEPAAAADPLPLARALLRCASVTPADDGALDVLDAALTRLGFRVSRLQFGGTPNLYARLGEAGPHFCFAGHTDVVPPGEAGWTAGPFAAELRDGVLYGRGACDMKGAIAAFVAAVETHLARGRPVGSISLLITGDEEGPATDGTVRVLDWMRQQGEVPDFCLVGEPSNPSRLGEVIKIGRRGSLNARIAIQGVQGHSAYPQRADNPVHRLVRVLAALIADPLDAGTDWFEPSTLQITSVDVGNAATNVIPAQAEARLNIRFNDRHTGASLESWLRQVIARHAETFTLHVAVSGEAFLTQPGALVERVRGAIARMTGITPRLDTGGGTSDARFITQLCPVAEFGLVGATMHQVDECVPVADLRALADIYGAVLEDFFA